MGWRRCCVLGGIVLVGGVLLQAAEIPSATMAVVDSARPYYSSCFPENTLKGLEQSTARTDQFCVSGMKTGWIEYCFNEAVALTNLHVWNYNETGYVSYGMSNIQIEVSSDWGENYSLVTNPLTALTFFTLSIGSGTSNNISTRIPLQHTCTHLRIRSLNTFGTANYSGLSTVRFYGNKPGNIERLTNVAVAAWSSFTTGRVPSNTIDGTPYIGDYNYQWLGVNGDTNAWIVFRFGRPVAMSHLMIWNYSQGGYTTRGMKEILLQRSLDGVNFIPFSFPEAGTTTLRIAPGTGGGNLGDVVRLDSASAEYIRISCISNWGSTTHSGLSEVFFYELKATEIASRGTLILIR